MPTRVEPEYTPVECARIPWLALTLSMCCPGLGQLYCGRSARGLVMMGAFSLFGPMVAVTVLIATPTASLMLLATWLLAYLLVGIWSAYDAKRIATEQRGQGYSLQDYNHWAVYVLLILTSFAYGIGPVLLLRLNVLEAFYIPTSSMAPTLVPGDRILVRKLGVSTRSFARGEVIVFRNPEDLGQIFVKRIVGLPGDRVEVKGRELRINNQLLHEVPADSSLQDFKDLSQTIPAGSYFVLGDHRDLSRDSRSFGLLAHGEIVGIVTYRFWPAQTWSRFGPVD